VMRYWPARKGRVGEDAVLEPSTEVDRLPTEVEALSTAWEEAEEALLGPAMVGVDANARPMAAQPSTQRG
jgi:hypothetical protein